ncbi:MAG: tripartite tricarboxylate transporter TctB family protein [Rubrobacter sp.]|nr:tripartite tricarboxylate transporter TctB family protein [Rubrobacter sp.]
MSERGSSGGDSRRGVFGLRFAAGVVLLFAVVVFIQAVRIGAEGGFGPEGSGFFPLIVTAGLLFFAALFVLQITLRPDTALLEHAAEEAEDTNWRTVGLAIVCLLVYAFLLAPLGYVIATTIFFPVVARVFGSRRWVRDIVIGLAASLVLFVGFTQFLGVRLPAGILEVFF